MPTATVNGVTVHFDNSSELVEFLRLYGASEPAPSAQSILPASKSLTKRAPAKGTRYTQDSVREMPREAVLAFLNAVTDQFGSVKPSVIFADFGVTGPRNISYAMNYVKQVIKDAGFDPTSVLVHKKTSHGRSWAPGPHFVAFYRQYLAIGNTQ